MIELIIAVFVIGYLAIALEHPIHVNKAASALITGVLCWTIYMMMGTHSNPHDVVGQLEHFISEVASILFFLLGAMTIVELIDAHEGFKVITDKITTTNKVKLLWIISFVAFFFSAALDNLTTSIVMVSLLRKLIEDKHDRMFFAGMVVVAANAGGAWSPIGDVTTTMLWIGGQITAGNIVATLLLPSLVCLLAPLLILSFTLKGEITRPKEAVKTGHHAAKVNNTERNIVFCVGVGGLLFVPIFKTVTHLPPFMGMLFSLGVLWVLTELLHKSKNDEDKEAATVVGVIRRIDTPSVLFFLGILVAIGSLQATGVLTALAQMLDDTIGNQNIIVMSIGLLSSIVDNVPLVAAAMKMYSIEHFPQDNPFWEFLAYAAGTGGSCLIIGSAAGVAVMGMEKIDFFWYLKKIGLLALVGYLAGAGVYLLTYPFFAVH